VREEIILQEAERRRFISHLEIEAQAYTPAVYSTPKEAFTSLNGILQASRRINMPWVPMPEVSQDSGEMKIQGMSPQDYYDTMIKRSKELRSNTEKTDV